jgi:hypothetical protein
MIKMSTNSHERRQRANSENCFTRHPVVTISTLLTIVLLICLMALELFLRTFSGLGNPPLYELSPLYGYRLKANQSIKPWGNMSFLYGAGMTTNNFGLRAAGEWDLNQTGKILFLGDSVTYGGQYIADAQLFSSVTGSRLHGWQVGNGGHNAWGVENIVGFMMDYGFPYAEVVVTCVIEGDFYRGITRASSLPIWTERPRFALQDFLMHFIWKANESRYGSAGDMVVQDGTHLDKIVDRAAKRLKDLDSYLKQHQARHFLFILPTKTEIVDGAPPDSRVGQALRRYEIDANYLLPELLSLEPDKEKRREWFRDEVHLEVPGHYAYGILIGDLLSHVLSDK